jgi:nitrite reductase/ring-hydroxylating ferredoxin subunit
MTMGDARAVSCTGNGCTRRAVLTGAGAAGLTGVLAACGDETTPPPPPPRASTAGPSTSVLTTTAALTVGGGTVVEGVLVVQPTAGVYKAYDAACPHKGVMVSAPKDGVITCAAHKSTFKLEDGSRISGPATQGLNPVNINVDGTNIVRAA